MSRFRVRVDRADVDGHGTYWMVSAEGGKWQWVESREEAPAYEAEEAERLAAFATKYRLGKAVELEEVRE